MKFLLILIVAIGAAFGIPSVRHRIMTPLEPVLVRVGPIGEKLATPARRWNAKNEAEVIARKVAEQKDLHRPFPTPRRFTQWIQQNMRGLERKGMDPWGNPYYLERTDRTITVGSAAQDGVPGTEDDVRVTVAIP